MRLKHIADKILPNRFKKTAANLLKKFVEPSAVIKRLLAFKGTFKVMVEGRHFLMLYKNRWIENAIFWKGINGYEKESVAIWLKAVTQANTIADVGANAGLYSLLAKTFNPAAEVYAFEPLPLFKNDLLANCVANNFDVTIEEVALSNFCGQAKFYVPEEYAGNLYSSSLSKEHYYVHQPTKPIEIDVAVHSFDAFSAKKNFTPVDLVKIDAEGHDYEVLEGMQETIMKHQPDFLIEIQSDETGQKIMNILTPSVYSYFMIDENSGLQQVANLRKGNGLNFFICKHHTASKLKLYNNQVA